MSSPRAFDPDPTGCGEHGVLLLDVARGSIEHGIARGEPLPVDPGRYPAVLREIRASFTTLHRGGELRGCVGGLEARRPLVVDVARSAFAAAFQDPRFPTLRADELPELSVHVAVLSRLERLEVRTEEDVLRAIRPGIDGLVVRAGFRQGTFLPAVWESLPEPRDFLRQLKRKAQLPEREWSPTWEVLRYTVESIG